MLPHERDAMSAIRAVYGAPVTYFRAGAVVTDAIAVRSDMRPASFQGFSGRPAGLSFEVERSLLPMRPAKRDIIREAGGARWSVIDIDEADDIDSWILTVEEAEPLP